MYSLRHILDEEHAPFPDVIVASAQYLPRRGDTVEVNGRRYVVQRVTHRVIFDSKLVGSSGLPIVYVSTEDE